MALVVSLQPCSLYFTPRGQGHVPKTTMATMSFESRRRRRVVVTSLVDNAAPGDHDQVTHSIYKDYVAEAKQVVQERDFTGTPYVPIYVMLPLGVIDMNSEVVEPEVLKDQQQ